MFKLPLYIGPFLVLALLSFGSEAASFDCDRAKAPRERMICAEPDLSRADEKLAAAFKTALDALSEEGRSEFRKGQRAWIEFTDVVCSTSRKTQPVDPKESSVACLKREYEKRQKQLETAVVKRNGLVIRRVDVFKAMASEQPHGDGHYPNFTTTETAYPQIDKPRDDSDRRWNKLITDEQAPMNAADEEDEDIQGGYALGSVSPAMISARLQSYEYLHGTQHGMLWEKGVTWLLRQGRELRAEDVFDKNRAWAAALARLVFDTAKSNEERDGYGRDFPVDDPKALQTAAVDPAHWLITQHGLSIRFTFREANLEDVGGVDADIPWRTLKPYLLAPLPFDIAPD